MCALPAYYFENTSEKDYGEISCVILDEVILVVHCSTDKGNVVVEKIWFKHRTGHHCFK